MPQLVSEAIAAVANNNLAVGPPPPSSNSPGSDMLLVRVLGPYFSFYRIPVSNRLLAVVQGNLKGVPRQQAELILDLDRTVVSCFTSKRTSLGFDITKQDERKLILEYMYQLIFKLHKDAAVAAAPPQQDQEQSKEGDSVRPSAARKTRTRL